MELIHKIQQEIMDLHPRVKFNDEKTFELKASASIYEQIEKELKQLVSIFGGMLADSYEDLFLKKLRLPNGDLLHVLLDKDMDFPIAYTLTEIKPTNNG